MSSTKRSNDREIQTVEIPFFTQQHRGAGRRVRAGGVTNLKGFQAAKLHPRVRKKRPLLRGFCAAGHATSPRRRYFISCGAGARATRGREAEARGNERNFRESHRSDIKRSLSVNQLVKRCAKLLKLQGGVRPEEEELQNTNQNHSHSLVSR